MKLLTYPQPKTPDLRRVLFGLHKELVQLLTKESHLFISSGGHLSAEEEAEKTWLQNKIHELEAQ